jgi:hypothetical protein
VALRARQVVRALGLVRVVRDRVARDLVALERGPLDRAEVLWAGALRRAVLRLD